MRSSSAGGIGRERVGGGDEEHPREVEGHLEVVVAEGRVLLRVEHLEQRRRRDRRGSRRRACRSRRAGRPGCASPRGAGSAGCGPASRRRRCGGGRGSRPRRARRRARRARTCAPSRARSSGRARSCRRPAARRSRGSGPSPRARACAPRGTRGCGPSPSRGRGGPRRGPRARRARSSLSSVSLRPGQVRDPLEVGADQVAVGRVRRAARAGAAARARPASRRLAGSCAASRRSCELLDLALPGVALADLALDVAHAAAQQPLALLRVHLLVGARRRRACAASRRS